MYNTLITNMNKILFLISYFYLSIFNSLYASTLNNLPEPTGPYQIGIAKHDLTDCHRKELAYPDGRLIPIQIYFPMQKGMHTLHSKIYEERADIADWPSLEANVYSQKADLSLLSEGQHPVIVLNHGNNVPMTDYAFIAEDLASHGYVVVAIQHQLKTDAKEPIFWNERSISRHAMVIDNILCVFEWLKENQKTLFDQKIDLKHIGLVGHSMGGNSLLLFASRSLSIFKKKNKSTLLPHENEQGVKECLIVLDTGGYPYPSQYQYPLFFLLSEERELYQKQSGAYDEMLRIGYKVQYYKGSKHISFMDHGCVNPSYFNGNDDERKTFFDQVRADIRDFLEENLK